LEELDIKGDLTYTEYPIKILGVAKESLGVKLSECVRFSGTGILRMRQHGKERKI